jgi:probable F420-dependent oxidoreductase
MTAGIGTTGVWTSLWQWPSEPDALAAAAGRLEGLGYPTVWIGTALPDLALPEAILAATEKLVVATGILDVWRHPAAEAAARHDRLRRAYPGRFVLGLGPSHAPLVEGLMGKEYVRPLQQVGRYLDELDAAVPPVPKEERVLAALGPKALQLAAERAAGAHPYNVTPEHTATAREVLGTGPLLAPEQKVLVETDPTVARAIGRKSLAIYLDLPNYVNNWRRLGFDDADFADGGSDRLIDHMVAWGDVDTVRRRVQEHRDAGADHVAVQVLNPEGYGSLPLDGWEAAAPAVLS